MEILVVITRVCFYPRLTGGWGRDFLALKFGQLEMADPPSPCVDRDNVRSVHVYKDI